MILQSVVKGAIGAVALLSVYRNKQIIIILGLVVSGVRPQYIKFWRHENRGRMRLFIGLLLVGLGWLLIFIANGIINFG